MMMEISSLLGLTEGGIDCGVTWFLHLLDMKGLNENSSLLVAV